MSLATPIGAGPRLSNGQEVSLAVLGSEAEIREARAQLQRDRCSCLRRGSGRLDRFLRRLRGRPPRPPIGELRKSWDVLRTVDLIGRTFPPDARVLDLGAHTSEILLILQRKGFRRLTGVDLDPRVLDMPGPKGVRWEVADFMATGYPASSFEVITAISAIEHGLEAGRLLTEVSRLLSPGGYFVASFDYWPQKLSTDDIRLYGLSWTIFSREEVVSLVEQAAGYGLRPIGPLQFEARERPIHYADRDYTFAWLALRKELG